jgi:WS/DGAT/MGAT family acyltransferase
MSDRLSALDASFLEIESESCPMHVGAVLTFDGESLLSGGKPVLTQRLRRYIDHALDGCERYRQRLKYIPGLRHPVWVDDEQFDLDWHLRRARVAAPGTDEELMSLASHLLSTKLDRSRPLWEMYVVDGLSKKRVAVVVKIHHCMIDGVGGMQLLMSLLRPYRDTRVPRGHSDWVARPAPSTASLLVQELRHRGRGAADLVRRSIGGDGLRKRAGGIWSAAKSRLPNWGNAGEFTCDETSGYRRFEWTTVDLGEVKEIRHSLGGTVNDVVLALVAGAARRYLLRQGLDPTALEPLRAVLPVHTGGASRGEAGNYVAMVMTNLPVDEASPRDRLNQVVEDTERLKEDSHQVEGAQLVEDIADVFTRRLLSSVFKLAFKAKVFDLIVTNLRGPSFPLYLLDARLESVYPVVPLMPGQNLGIALFSYDGRIHFGFNSDDRYFGAVDDFIDDLNASFDELRQSCRRETNADRPQHATSG